jgi:hypothetical protein
VSINWAGLRDEKKMTWYNKCHKCNQTIKLERDKEYSLKRHLIEEHKYPEKMTYKQLQKLLSAYFSGMPYSA